MCKRGPASVGLTPFVRTKMFRSGFIISPRADLIWFLGLPYLAIGFALACFAWLPPIVWASIALWITIPHHWATWLRTYGLKEDWQRWKGPLVVGPIVILSMALLGIWAAPTTLLILVGLWDHQHSLMQQHGLARIYDFKARAGSALTGRFDLLLNWFLYVNLLITAPLHAGLWIREASRWQLPISFTSVQMIQYASWTATAVFLAAYVGHTIWSFRRGHAINPAKYWFIGSSYFLWYFASWHTDSFLIFGIAHRLMHGLQYIVIVHAYLGRKTANAGNVIGATSPPAPSWLTRLVKSRAVLAFIGMGALYALVYQLLVLRPLDEFGFGVVSFMAVYGDVPHMGLAAITKETGYDLFAASLIQALPITHYYFDSFIWKVSDTKIQQGL